MDAKVEVRCYDPTTRHLGSIDASTALHSLAQRQTTDSGSVAAHELEVLDGEEPVKSSFQPPSAAWFEEVHQLIISALELAIAPLMSSLIAMDKRFKEIESGQDLLQQASKES